MSSEEEDKAIYDGNVDIVIIRNILKDRTGATVEDEVLYDFWKSVSKRFDSEWASIDPVEDADKIADFFVEFLSLENNKELEIRYKSGGGFTPEQCRQKINNVLKKMVIKNKPNRWDKFIDLDEERELYDLDPKFVGTTVPIYAATFPTPTYNSIVAYAAPLVEKHHIVSIIGYGKSKRLDMIRKMRDLDPDKGLGVAKDRLDNLPYVINPMASDWEVKQLKTDLESVGFTVEVKEI